MNALTVSRPLPPQDAAKILLHATRFRRDADALRPWAQPAKKAVDYYENRQWAAADLARLAAEGRPAITINKIRPLVNLVMGYHINNRTDLQYLPGLDGTGLAEIASALTHTAKQVSEANQLPYIDSEVMLDGLLSGRGYWDIRMDFQTNSLGEAKIRAEDPFSTYLDSDADQYDVSKHNRISTSRMIAIEEVEFFYGTEAASRVGPFMRMGGVNSGLPTGYPYASDEISPLRRFALEEDGAAMNFYGDYFHDWIDPARKSIRLLDLQHYVLSKRWYFEDLETGATKAIPDGWNAQKVEKTLMWAREQGQPLIVTEKRVRRLRWTHMIGDVMVYDAWSPYETPTLVPFFPYFRRGVTQGFVEPLMDAQDEVNKRRSARLNILGRSSSTGWKFEKGSLDAQQKRNLEMFGSTPGVLVEYETRGGKLQGPEQINMQTTPASFAQIEKDANEDIKEIAGINDSALGQVDTSVLSGRAIERRQRQALVGLEGFISNHHRSKELVGRKLLELIQGHYTEQRIIRVTGAGRQQIQVVINQRTAQGIVNDVSLGSYSLVIDETPLSKSFLEAQFDELMKMKEIGMPVPDDFIIDASSIGRKEELKVALAQARVMEAQQAAAAAAAGAPAGEGGGPPGIQGSGPGGSRTGADGGSMPAGPEPGAPPPAPMG